MKERYLRADTKGRVRTPRERREQLLDEFEQTGASAAAFARIIGVRYSTFAAWVNRRKKLGRASERAQLAQPLARFVEATPSVEALEAARDRGLRVGLPGGGEVMISSPREVELAAELLRALERKELPRC
jgi:transposase-like protein